ncbi:MAG TPA: vWA domain-containing protein [Pirellulales bacterium]|jgi:alkylated DNA nucleotide flippase Atl1|nr:vWA domain-containing protein [Pirellulales bacterium]
MCGKAVGNIRGLGPLCLLGAAALFVAALISTGCEIKIEPPAEKPPPVIKLPPAQAALVGLGARVEKQQAEAAAAKATRSNFHSADTHAADRPPQAETTPRPHREDILLAANDQPAQNKGNRPGGVSGGKFDVPQAVEQIALEINDALELRKTLVVLLVEQTSKASSLVGSVADRFTQLAHELEKTHAGQFQMAVAGYSDGVNWILPEPAGDANAIETALLAAKDTKGDKAHVFAAVNQACGKFLPQRMHGWEVIFVVAGSSPGDDLNLADQAIKALRKAAVPVYGIGPAAPFGSPRFKVNASRRAGGTGDMAERQYESLFPERIQLSLSGNQNTVDLNDSGYGPFGLARLCWQTQGKFFRQHAPKSAGWIYDANAGDIKPELLLQYAPDYVDEAQYQQLLQENKCRLALHNAAMLPPAEGLGQVTTEFRKEKDEAALAKNITNAQKAAAIDDQPLQRLYDALVAGEGDRPKLTGARWQAGYDLAMGQVLAAKARLDGYNAILAIIKQGKAFANADSAKWVLEPANENAAGSVLDKMTKKSRAYLQRVVAEHPGTPWAAVAERELKYPAGWKLEEK